MIEPKALDEASLEGAKEPSRPVSVGLMPTSASGKSPVLVPIRSLGVNHRVRINRHLLALDPHDRYLRFGFSANDAQIQRYADSLNFERDEIFGIYNRRIELIAMAHLAFSADSSLDACAEFGVSVLKSARGRGYGARLFDRAAMHARNEGVSRMFIHALSENTAMLKIARQAGATVERDGSESEAHLLLLPATLDTRLSELLQEQFAQTNYRVKVQVKQFWDVLAGVQALRRDVQDAQQITPK
ncbi:GNAT family N-acetyltransferase [Rhodoferax ferrireducens]|uniref:GNAT family N-acetyltransferase n=1 Tax=Rhodoferax ferrireducens TaxID=192843 RepID=UPI000E0CE7CF|nr:GNAT family N-acetyltransferase [Rhodoferax ferrireducens]